METLHKIKGLLTGADERAAKIRENFRKLPKTRIEAKHTEGCSVLPHRLALLSVLPSDAVAAEIGVAEGNFSEEILRRANPRKLFLIDAWEGERYGPRMKKVTDRFATEIKNQVVHLRQGLSFDEIPKLDDESLDWVYIDTDHSYDTTLKELRLVRSKLKNSGFIAGHDFSMASGNTGRMYGVIFACHQFCAEENWRYAYITLDEGGAFSFCLKRI
jgi:hypothetical protein